LFATVCEMAFAAHVGVTLNLDLLAYDEAAHDVEGNERPARADARRDFERVLAALFSEELGAVIQIRTSDRGQGVETSCGLARAGHRQPESARRAALVRNAKPCSRHLA